MSELTFSDVKVHNEIEYCIVQDPDIKVKIERAFLNNRISYYEKWEEPSLFRKLLPTRTFYHIFYKKISTFAGISL